MAVELHTETEDEYFTIQEINQLLQNLSEADIFRLKEIAGRYIRHSLMEADDLFHDAIVAIASGDRTFKREVPLIAFFAGTMKSLASNEKRKRQKFIAIGDESADENIDIEKNAIADQELEEIYKLFEKDTDVETLLIHKLDELTPSEICEKENWDKTKYNAVNKRLRRALNKRFPNGREI
ncbi:MAG: sigma-70 family RNA polymerase sigma factor [Methylovulum sp.]|nr:sigma-70 family RNA polymerase sigma factor [Methylovulum sp.]